MKDFIKENWVSWVLGAGSLILVWIIWLVASNSMQNQYVLPTVSQTLNALWVVLGEQFFYKALSKTLLKVIYSVLISFVLAGALALLSKVVRRLDAFFAPIISIIRTVPTMAILIIILLSSTRFVAPIIVAVLVLFPMMYKQFSTALNGIDQGIINATKVFGLTKKQRIIKVYLPLVMPPIILNVGSNLSFAIKLIISAEVMANVNTSIGGMMQGARTFDYARLFALTLASIIIGLLIEVVFHLVCKTLFKWNKKGATND